MRILLGVLLLYTAASTFGQTLPIKEGLWENIVLNDDGTPAMRSLDCFTQKSFAEMMVKASTRPGCKVTSQNITNHGMTVDISCNRPNIQMIVHSVVELVDSGHERTTTTMKMTVRGNTKESSTKSTGHFVKSDCGNIKPGNPEVTAQ